MKLFLTSSFADTYGYLESFLGENIRGKTVTFIPTACIPEDYKGYMDHDKKAFQSLGVIVDELDVSQDDISNEMIRNTLQKNDLIFVGGGNTFFLLQEIRKSGAYEFIEREVHHGKPYIGTSAGSMIAAKNIEYSEAIDDKTKAKNLNSYDAFGFVDFYVLPHYLNEPFKECTQKIFDSYSAKIPLIPINNTQAVGVKNGKKEIFDTSNLT